VPLNGTVLNEIVGEAAHPWRFDLRIWRFSGLRGVGSMQVTPLSGQFALSEVHNWWRRFRPNRRSPISADGEPETAAELISKFCGTYRRRTLMNDMKYVYKTSAITAAALLAVSTLVAVVGAALAA
jgi:hypothetical protein